MANILQIPFSNDVVEQQPGADGASRYTITNEWSDWLLELLKLLTTAARRLGLVILTAQGGAIATSPIVVGVAAGTLFRVSYTTQVEQAASSTSTLTVVVSYIQNGFTVQQSGQAMTSNAPTLPASGSFLVKADDSNFSFSTNYGSVGATPMTYRILVVAETIPS